MNTKEHSILRTISSTIVGLNQWIMIGIALTMTLIVIYQIVARIGNFSVRWTEEFARLLSIWATFLAVPVLISHRRLINIDFFQLKFPRKVQQVLSLFQIILAIVTFLVLVRIGLQQVITTWNQTSPGLLWPLGLFTLPIVLSSVLSLIVIPDWIREAFQDSDDKLDMEKYM